MRDSDRTGTETDFSGIERSGATNKPLALVVEDNSSVAQLLASVTRGCGFDAEIFTSVESAAQKLDNSDPALILLDIHLPGRSGFEWLREIRESRNGVPVIIVSGVHQTSSKVALLSAGADDYITKPFDIFELEARIKAVSRRPRNRRFLSFFDGRLGLDPAASKVTWDDASIRITQREFGILLLLASATPAFTSASALAVDALGYSDKKADHDCAVHIANLRGKLANLTQEITIENRRKVGYALLQRSE